METLLQDLRHAARMLRQNPSFTLVVIGALALGIGANTAIFSVVRGTLLRSLPYNDAERLVTFGSSFPDYRDIRDSARSFDKAALWASNQYTVPGKDNAEQVLGAVVSPEFFPVLGEASLGRTFAPEEDRAEVAVISHDYWVSHYSSDPGALGKTLKLNDQLYTVIGVMPREFSYPSGEFKVWVPFNSAMQKTPQQVENRQLRIFRVVAHLAPGISISQAQAELESINALLAKQYPATNDGVRYRIRSLSDAIVGQLRPVLFALLGTVTLVLLIACANVANLLLAKTTSRLREVSVRAALGAGIGRLIRQFLTESVLLSAIGSMLGLVLAYAGLHLLRTFNPGGLPRMESIRIDAGVLWFTAAVAISAGVLFGLAPAWQASKTNPLSGLRDGGRSASAGTSSRRLRDGLVVSEIAFSLVVLIAAGLLVKSFDRLLHIETGFLSEHLLSVPVLLINIDKEQRAQVVQQVVDRVAALPGITAVGGGTGLPPITAQRGTKFEVQGTDNSNPDARFAYFLIVTPNYFQALGTAVLQGRAFTEHDDAAGPKTVIVNRELAQRLFPGQDAIGKQIRLVNPDQSPDWRTVVGVVQRVRYSGLDDSSDAQIYTPFAQTPSLWTYLMVRSGPSGPSIAAIREAIESANAALTAGRAQSMDELISTSVARPRFQAALVGSFAILGLALAVIGIYGVVSYSVAQRTHEIGVRMAIGAQRFHVLRMVVGEGSRLALVGIAIGVAGALAASRVLASMLFEVKTTDAVTFVAVSGLLAAVALLACYVPARRAMKVDPIVALRYE